MATWYYPYHFFVGFRSTYDSRESLEFSLTYDSRVFLEREKL